MRFTIRPYRREQRDPAIGIGYVKVDPRDVGEIIAVLVSLKKEMPAIVKARLRAARVLIEYQIGILVRFGFGRFDRLDGGVVQKAEISDDSGRIFECIDPLCDKAQREVWWEEVAPMSDASVGAGNATAPAKSMLVRQFRPRRLQPSG